MRSIKADPVSIHVAQKLADLTTLPDPFIFKVHRPLRDVNEIAYEPVLLAIGPYHRHKEHLIPIEQQKLHYLELMLRRMNQSTAETYIMALRELEKRARRCYAESMTLTADEFVEMMLLDGCFIIELFRKYAMSCSWNQCDPIFQISWMLGVLRHDLLLFENQLPFFVVAKLFNMSEVGNRRSFNELALYFFNTTIPYSLFLQEPESTCNSIPYFEHLLSLVHTAACPSLVEIGVAGYGVEKDHKDFISIPSATELQEDGVKFKKLEGANNLFEAKTLERGWYALFRFKKGEGDSLFDMKFNNGLLEISQLQIDKGTECFLRNLIAYEQYKGRQNGMYVTDYVALMDALINSPMDVELLRQGGIIVNRLGDDDSICTMFNRLCQSVLVPRVTYKEICRNVDKHCREHRHSWMVKLRRNSLRSRLVLLLFLIASVFCVLSYLIPRK
ncbi:hypothetical protein CJ030_MR2G007766 [Morella rubra]|uniref:Uncharacterized protein n=1 Tax=Morella rubra TaxID=262757 RepID=A0A6A1WGN0_9ROSI|nr:hypothetical protein CJ030_MR2G007766 [Morella rubra]